jgi:hypothetical protein
MARKEKKYHFIYKTTNLLSGKYYIGMHSTSNLEDGYMGSGKRLRYSVNKYGKENHRVEIIEFLQDRNELKKREREIVNLNEIAKQDCLNLMVGGDGGRGFTIEEQKANAKKSKKKIEWLKANDKEWLENFKKNRSKGQKEVYDENRRERKYFYDWSGKTHTKETRELQSKVKKGVGTGEKNSQFGTCWITKNGDNKKIKKEEVQHYLNDNWILGRKINSLWN